MNKLGKNLVTFLPRRMYENYLVHASAITQVVNGIAGFSATPIAESDVQKLIDKKRSAGSYFCNGQIPQDAAEWVREIDGAKVLKEIFADLSQNRVTYDKVKHSVELTKWIIENAPAELEGVAALLTQIAR